VELQDEKGIPVSLKIQPGINNLSLGKIREGEEVKVDTKK